VDHAPTKTPQPDNDPTPIPFALGTHVVDISPATAELWLRSQDDRRHTPSNRRILD